LGTGGLFLRKLRAMVSAEPTGFVWVERGRLAGSGYPASRGQVEWLVRSGIRTILTLTENPLPAELTDGLGVSSVHVAMRDHEPPMFESIESAVKIIETETSAGRPVLVHCLAGEGRTGCVIASYLIKTRGVGAEEALRRIREVKPEFVEHGQESAVFEFASRLRG